jgi:hypothetical protein
VLQHFLHRSLEQLVGVGDNQGGGSSLKDVEAGGDRGRACAVYSMSPRRCAWVTASRRLWVRSLRLM